MVKMNKIAQFNSINFVQLLLILILPYTSAQTDAVDPDNTKYKNNDSGIKVFAIVSLVILLILWYFYERGKARNIPVTDHPDGVPLETSSVEGIGLTVIKTFPVFVYSDVKDFKKVHNIKGTVLECAVCLSEFVDKDMLRLLPCNHVFHPQCTDDWFVSHSTCPICRRDLKSMVTSGGDTVIDVYEDNENHSEGTAVSETEHVDTRVSLPSVQNSEQVIDGINPDNETNQFHARKYQRSHSTGHSLIQRRQENSERYILRLPDDVRKDILRWRSLNCRCISGGSSHCGCSGSGGAESSNRGQS
ncbi:hypothetical protein MKW92_039607 [Papaver armeniacum]|nr:hypothetical protein MKW92_039607 [Papaver armeniacum]